ncbi:hypothetical protein BDQ17DRAFT_1514095, partial [Cyathus striatus]
QHSSVIPSVQRNIPSTSNNCSRDRNSNLLDATYSSQNTNTLADSIFSASASIPTVGEQNDSQTFNTEHSTGSISPMIPSIASMTNTFMLPHDVTSRPSMPPTGPIISTDIGAHQQQYGQPFDAISSSFVTSFLPTTYAITGSNSAQTLSTENLTNVQTIEGQQGMPNNWVLNWQPIVSVPVPQQHSRSARRYESMNTENESRNNDSLLLPFRRRPPRKLFGVARKPYSEPNFRPYLGRMEIPCIHCGALHWIDEKLTKSSKKDPRFGTCCLQGKVKLPSLQPPPDTLYSLLTNNNNDSIFFREHIWQYNCAFAFTSVGFPSEHEDRNINDGNCYPIFRLCGEIHHYSGSLNANGELPRYAQLYVIDPDIAYNARLNRNNELQDKPHIMCYLQNMLNAFHQYVPLYRHAYEIIQHYGHIEDAEVRLQLLPDNDRRIYNLPTANQVAAILPGDNSKNPRDIILHCRQHSTLQRISELHPAYAPLQYPLLFSHGENGWHPDMFLDLNDMDFNENDDDDEDADEEQKERKLTLSRYVAYYLHSRRGQFNTALHGGRLFQRYIVDMFAAIDQGHL